MACSDVWLGGACQVHCIVHRISYISLFYLINLSVFPSKVHCFGALMSISDVSSLMTI